MSILPKAIYGFNAIPIKLPTVFFTELEQIISQFVWKYKKMSNSQSSLKKEEWSWRNQPSWFQIILQRYNHQDSMILSQKQKYRPMEQDWKPRNKPMHLWVPYFWRRRQEYTIQWEKVSLFNKRCWENWTAMCKTMTSEHFLMPYTKINSKWIKNLNVIPESIKLRGKHRKKTWWHKAKQNPLWATF